MEDLRLRLARSAPTAAMSWAGRRTSTACATVVAILDTETGEMVSEFATDKQLGDHRSGLWKPTGQSSATVHQDGAWSLMRLTDLGELEKVADLKGGDKADPPALLREDCLHTAARALQVHPCSPAPEHASERLLVSRSWSAATGTTFSAAAARSGSTVTRASAWILVIA